MKTLSLDDTIQSLGALPRGFLCVAFGHLMVLFVDPYLVILVGPCFLLDGLHKILGGLLEVLVRVIFCSW